MIRIQLTTLLRARTRRVFTTGWIVLLAAALIAGLVGALTGAPAALEIARAQGDPDAFTDYQLNLRAGPGTDFATLGVLPVNTAVTAEARSEDGTWLLVTSGDLRGWVAARFLRYADDFNSDTLPVSSEELPAPPDDAADDADADEAAETAGEDEAAAAEDDEADATAAAGPDATTDYALNLRAGPGTDFASLGVLPPGTALDAEARNDDGTWLLVVVVAEDDQPDVDALRGWIAARFLSYAAGFDADALPVSSEELPAPVEDATGDDADAADDDPEAEQAAAEADAADAAAAAGVGQGEADAWTNYQLNMRAGPGLTFYTLATLPVDTPLRLEAQDATGGWVLARTTDNTNRGWLSVLYLRFADGVSVPNLPVSDEVIDAADPADDDAGGDGGTVNSIAAVSAADPQLAAALDAIPVVPAIPSTAISIYQAGANNPRRFSKIGDCNSATFSFMSPFDTGQYDLGDHDHLQGAIDHFAGSFARESLAAHVGFNALTIIDADWADPGQCQGGESSVWCELRVYRPAVAVVMFGANDVYNLSMTQYETSLRRIVDFAIDNGTIPVLSTFAWCGGGDFGAKALQMNMLTVNLAREYGVPVINFWKAAQDLPNCGLNTDGVHLSSAGPPYGCYLTGDENEAGFTLRSMVTLQTLDAIRLAALS